jgi:hypothetical protein
MYLSISRRDAVSSNQETRRTKTGRCDHFQKFALVSVSKLKKKP